MITSTPSSLIDIGGGAGSWAAAAKELGVAKVRVLDRCPAEQVVKSLDAAEHVECDLEGDIPVLGDFDLAISIEVVEHLTPAASNRVIERLVGSSKVILFSGAVPGQGGIGHLNEQWHGHWHDLFSSHGYKCYDVLRLRLLSRFNIPWFIRQNIFIYASRDDRGATQSLEQLPVIAEDLEIVRKEHLLYLHGRRPGLREILAALPDAVRNAIHHKMNR